MMGGCGGGNNKAWGGWIDRSQGNVWEVEGLMKGCGGLGSEGGGEEKKMG